MLIATVFPAITAGQERIQVLWDLNHIQFWGPYLRKRIQNYEYKIRYVRKYLFRSPPKVLQVVRASERP
jgi:hypothetical protein